MSYVDIYTTTIEETGEVFLDEIWLTDPYPYGVGKWLLETKFNKNIHGSLQSITSPKLPTGHLIKSAMDQHQVYRKNLRLLYQEFIKKFQIRMFERGLDYQGMWNRVGMDLLKDLMDLHHFVGDAKSEPYREGYLTDIFRYWRTVADPSEIRRFEDLWVFVAGRPHRQE